MASFAAMNARWVSSKCQLTDSGLAYRPIQILIISDWLSGKWPIGRLPLLIISSWSLESVSGPDLSPREPSLLRGLGRIDFDRLGAIVTLGRYVSQGRPDLCDHPFANCEQSPLQISNATLLKRSDEMAGFFPSYWPIGYDEQL